LIHAGHDVVLVGRMAEEVRAHGLTLTDYEGGRWILPPEKTRYEMDARLLFDREAVLVTVKSTATAAAAAELAPVLPSGALVASLQNGVSNAAELRAGLPGRTVVAGMVPFNVLRQPQAHFHNGTSGAIELERASGACANLASALKEAGFAVRLS